MRPIDPEELLARKHAFAISYFGISQWLIRRCYCCFGQGDREVTIWNGLTNTTYKESWCEECWGWVNMLFDFWTTKGLLQQRQVAKPLLRDGQPSPSNKKETVH